MGENYASLPIAHSPLPLLCLCLYGTRPKGRVALRGTRPKGESLCERETTASTKNTYNNYTKLPLISKHVPKHKNQLTLTALGYFLAGLIEGDRWFGKKELHIIYPEKDIILAYLIKKQIRHGNIYKIKNKKAVRYICKNEKGLSIILSLINGKLVSKLKYDKLIKHNYGKIFNLTLLPPSNMITLDNF